MPKITFMGAGSTIFAKSILGDAMCSEALQGSEIALYDIDAQRLRESKTMMDTLNANINANRARVTAHLGVRNRKAALRDADYVVNAIQVGGYEPCTVIDFEVPRKYGLRQTIADTLGIGGIFRSLRTIPVVLDFGRDMQEVCPNALFINYTNPMAMITGGFIRGTGMPAVGLCHSVQGCARILLWEVGMLEQVRKLRWKIAGINHQAWLIEVADGRHDLYPEIRKRAAKIVAELRRRGPAKVVAEARKRNPEKWRNDPLARAAHDMVRLEVMRHFGYYVTESSEHTAEYMPHWIRSANPELIEEFNIPLDEYPRRCIAQIEGWKQRQKEIVENKALVHTRGHEFGSYIMEAMETDKPIRVHGNVMNDGLITNLPKKACVEVPCLVDRNGVQGCRVGDLPEVCAAVNRTNINVQILTMEAALTRRRDLVYQAAMMDPHTAAELTLDRIVRLCDDLIRAHGRWLPKYR